MNEKEGKNIKNEATHKSTWNIIYEGNDNNKNEWAKCTDARITVSCLQPKMPTHKADKYLGGLNLASILLQQYMHSQTL